MFVDFPALAYPYFICRKNRNRSMIKGPTGWFTSNICQQCADSPHINQPNRLCFRARMSNYTGVIEQASIEVAVRSK